MGPLARCSWWGESLSLYLIPYLLNLCCSTSSRKCRKKDLPIFYMLKWQRQTGQLTILQILLKICCLEWSLYLWFWGTRTTEVCLSPNRPNMSLTRPTLVHTSVCIQIKIIGVFLKCISANVCVSIFLFRPGKTTAFLLCPEMAELTSTDEWSSTGIWHETARVVMCAPGTKDYTTVCPVSWDL